MLIGPQDDPGVGDVPQEWVQAGVEVDHGPGQQPGEVPVALQGGDGGREFGDEEEEKNEECESVGDGHTIHTELKGEAEIAEENNIEEDCRDRLDADSDDDTFVHAEQFQDNLNKLVDAFEEEAKHLDSNVAGSIFLCHQTDKRVCHQTQSRWIKQRSLDKMDG